MSNRNSLRREISNVGANRRFEGTVLEVMNGLISVRMPSGQIVRGIRYSGARPSSGQSVTLDYTSGRPFAFLSSFTPMEADTIPPYVGQSENLTDPESVRVPGETALYDLIDVAVGSQTNGQGLIWDAALGKWVPGAPSSGVSLSQITVVHPDLTHEYFSATVEGLDAAVTAAPTGSIIYIPPHTNNWYALDALPGVIQITNKDLTFTAVHMKYDTTATVNLYSDNRPSLFNFDSQNGNSISFNGCLLISNAGSNSSGNNNAIISSTTGNINVSFNWGNVVVERYYAGAISNIVKSTGQGQVVAGFRFSGCYVAQDGGHGEFIDVPTGVTAQTVFRQAYLNYGRSDHPVNIRNTYISTNCTELLASGNFVNIGISDRANYFVKSFHSQDLYANRPTYHVPEPTQDGKTVISADGIWTLTDPIAGPQGEAGPPGPTGPPGLTVSDISFYVEGYLAPSTGLGGFVVPRDVIIESMFIRCGYGGSSGSTSVEMRVDGNLIFPESSLPFDETYIESTDPLIPSIGKGSIITFDITGAAPDSYDLSVIVVSKMPTSSIQTTIWEPMTNGDPDNPELLFVDGDVIMMEVPL